MKHKALALALTLMLGVCTLSACGDTATQPIAPPSSSPTSTTSEKPSAPAEPSPSSNVVAYSGTTFTLSASETTELLSEVFADGDLPNTFTSTPTIDETTGDVGTFTTYSYKICPGAQCILYEATESEKLAQIFLMGSSNSMSTDDAKVFGGYLATITAVFVADQTELDELDEALNIAESGFESGTMNMYTSSIANFSYIADGDIAMLTVTPA